MKRSFMKMKNIFAAVIFLVSVFYVFVSCSNLYDAGRENSTQNINDKNNTMCTITGSVSPGSALPSELCSIFNQNINSSKTAFPSVPTSGVSLQITAMNNDDNSKKYDAICHTDTSPWSFELNMPVGSYEIKAELKTTDSSPKVLMSCTENVTISDADPILDLNLTLEAQQTSGGTGKLSLMFKDGTTAGILSSVSINGSGVDNVVAYFLSTSKTATINIPANIASPELPSGSYSVNFIFSDTAEKQVYKIPLEKINIFDNMTTDTWYKYGQEPYLQQNDDGTASCVITDDCINRYEITNIWVHPTEGNDDNSGDGSAPVRTIEKAAQIVNNSSSAGPFTINLVDGAYDVDEQILFNKSIKIIGSSKEGTVINDNQYNSFLYSGASVEISVRDLTYKIAETPQKSRHAFFYKDASVGPVTLNLNNVCITSDSKKINFTGTELSVFKIGSDDKLNIKNCEFKNLNIDSGDNGCSGSLINIAGSTTIENTVFDSCQVSSNSGIWGGLIYCQDSSLNLTNVEFYKNTIKNEVGGTVCGGLICNFGTLTLNGVFFGVKQTAPFKYTDDTEYSNSIISNTSINGGLIYNNKIIISESDVILAYCKMKTINASDTVAGTLYTIGNESESELKFLFCYNNSVENSNDVQGVGIHVHVESNANENSIITFRSQLWCDDNSDIYLGKNNKGYYGQINLPMQLEKNSPKQGVGTNYKYFATISAPVDENDCYDTSLHILTGGKAIIHLDQFKVKPTGTGDNVQEWKIEETEILTGQIYREGHIVPDILVPTATNISELVGNSEVKKIGVTTVEQFELLANANGTFEGQTIKLYADMTLDDGFTPFGSAEGTPFKGMIDGNGKTITYNQSTELIKYANGCTVKNLTVEGNIKEIETEIYRGSLIQNASGDITLDKCVNKVNAEADENYNLSGFIYSYTGSGNVTITNCSNEGTLKVIAGVKVGGMIGSLNRPNGSSNPTVIIKNCSNSGGLINESSGSDSPTFGGIIGSANNSSLFIDSCSNTAETINYANTCGGIVGYIYLGSVTIINSYNTTDFVTSTSLTNGMWGGIIGDISSSDDNLPEEVKVINCYNTGNIDGDGTDYVGYKGGIIGRATHGTCKNCVNTGHISDYSGGDVNYHYYGGCIGQYSSANCVFEYLFTNENSIGTNYVLGETPNSGSITSYSISGTTPTVSPAIGDKTNLIDILNAWINAQDKPEDYFRWKTNSNGDPVLVIPTN